MLLREEHRLLSWLVIELVSAATPIKADAILGIFIVAINYLCACETC